MSCDTQGHIFVTNNGLQCNFNEMNEHTDSNMSLIFPLNCHCITTLFGFTQLYRIAGFFRGGIFSRISRIELYS